jgi:hypothetical protein
VALLLIGLTQISFVKTSFDRQEKINCLLDYQLRSGLGASALEPVWETVNEKRWQIQTKPVRGLLKS